MSKSLQTYGLWSPPGSSVCGVFQARRLEWVDMPFSRGSSWPRDQTCASCSSCTADRFFTTEPPGKPWSHYFTAKKWKLGQTIFLGSKITVDFDCSHEIKRCLFLGRKVMRNLDSIFKNRDITLSTKVHIVKAVIFPIVMYGCESWTIKNADLWRTGAFELWCWRTLESPL